MLKIDGGGSGSPSLQDTANMGAGAQQQNRRRSSKKLGELLTAPTSFTGLGVWGAAFCRQAETSPSPLSSLPPAAKINAPHSDSAAVTPPAPASANAMLSSKVSELACVCVGLGMAPPDFSYIRNRQVIQHACLSSIQFPLDPSPFHVTNVRAVCSHSSQSDHFHCKRCAPSLMHRCYGVRQNLAETQSIIQTLISQAASLWSIRGTWSSQDVMDEEILIMEVDGRNNLWYSLFYKNINWKIPQQVARQKMNLRKTRRRTVYILISFYAGLLSQ